MSFYDCTKARVRVESTYSQEFNVKFAVHQGSVPSTLLLAIIVNVITENARRGVINEVVFADDLFLLCCY